MIEHLILCFIAFWAGYYGVDTEVANELCFLESGFNHNAIGDDGKAVGLYQWHEGSLEYVEDKMKESGDIPKDYTLDRNDIHDSTRAAMYAIAELGLEDWWSAYPIAVERVEKGETEYDKGNNN